MTWVEEITPEERDAVEELKKRTIKDVTPKMLEDESLFYRFMKARDFNLDNAEAMLRKNIAFRKEIKADTILTDYTPPEVFKYFPNKVIGFDKEGSPVRYIDLGGGDVKGLVNSAKKIDMIKYNVQLVEQDVETMRQQSKKHGRPVTNIVYIYNFENFSFAKATHKKSLETMLLGARLYQDNYPERIKQVFQINASIYYTIMYSFIKSVIAAALIEKIQVFGSEGWKDALLQYIDADQLPVFLGGNRTDPDGNPLCKTFVLHGEMIPEKYYLRKSERKLSSASDVKKLTVTRFAKSEIRFDVEEAESLLEWEFETKSRDIGFGVYFIGRKNGQSKPIELVPKQRIDTDFEPETGMYNCERAGTYIIVFDNSYSWIHPKDIFYRARVIGPKEAEIIQQQ